MYQNFSFCRSPPPSLLVDADRAARLSLRGLDAAAPFGLSARDSGAVVVTDSTFRKVKADPGGGGFVFDNVTKVVVVGNSFAEVERGMLSVKKGRRRFQKGPSPPHPTPGQTLPLPRQAFLDVFA